jgi:hypothetical protein
VGEQAGPDFFVSFTSADATWAKWIAAELEKAGHTTVSQAQDFRPGHDFVHEMHRAVTSARRTIAVLSPDYLASEFGEAEWRVAFANDPSGQLGKLVPVKVRACQPPGLLRARVHVDLVDVDEETARLRLLDGVGPACGGPVGTTRTGSAPFPGARAATVRRGRRRVLAALVAGAALLITVTTSTAWALSFAASLPGRPSATADVTPTAGPAVDAATTTEPAPPSLPSTDVSAGAAPAAAPPPRVELQANGPRIGVPQLPPPIPRLEIEPVSLPSITVGEGWSETFEATGGVAPYRWSIVGSPPDGLSLRSDGLLGGTATTPTRAAFTIKVTDKRGEQATKDVVLEPNPRIGDITEDGPVDCADLTILQSQWNETGPDLSGDLDGDGVVDLTDMSILLTNWTGDDSSNC